MSFTGDTPQQSKGSLVRIPLVDKLHLDTWGYQIVSKNGTDSKIEVKLRVMPSVEALVGEWTMYVETIHKDSDDDEPEVHRYKHDKTLYVLFNPWCKGPLRLNYHIYIHNRILCFPYISSVTFFC